MSKRRLQHRDLRKPPAPAATPEARLAGFLRRRSLEVALALTLVASVRIASTYYVFNHTIDEPAHVACGMEWLDRKTYTYEDQHPPLARVMAALGPYLAGARSLRLRGIYQEGAMILYVGGNYDGKLALARLGILPFFWIASLVVYGWARRACGPLVAVVAVFLFTMLPPVLAHGGLATTDMAAAAFLGATAWALLVWLERPNWRNTGLLGVCGGLAVLSKFSALAFFPAAAVAMLAWHVWTARPGPGRLARQARRLALPLGLALVVAFLVVWAGYRFSFGKVHFADLRLPAPELFSGISTVLDHNAQGHPSYLLGQHSTHGLPHYYPVVLAVKTPLAFLILLAAGAYLCLKKRGESRCRMPLAFSLGVLVAAMLGNINIGVRHILAVYMGFAMVAAIAVAESAERQRRKWATGLIGGLLVWLSVSGALAHPDYLAYFNGLAGTEPEKVLADSDLDWDQDMKRLAQRLREVNAREVTFDPFIVAHLERVHGFPPIRPSNPFTPSPGWNAVSISVWKVTRLNLYQQYPGARLWPDVWRPTERVGKGVLLYYVPPAG